MGRPLGARNREKVHFELMLEKELRRYKREYGVEASPTRVLVELMMNPEVDANTRARIALGVIAQAHPKPASLKIDVAPGP